MFACYLPSLAGGFLWDDDANVSQNPTVRPLLVPGECTVNGGSAGVFTLKPTDLPQADRAWFVEAFGYNVTDERFQTYLANDSGAGVPLFAWNAPRSYGVRFAYSLSPY